jgi:hypothetical protein
MKSWVIWFKDGRYAYAEGETEDLARERWLREWTDGIATVVSAGEYPSQLPVERLVRAVKLIGVPEFYGRGLQPEVVKMYEDYKTMSELASAVTDPETIATAALVLEDQIKRGKQMPEDWLD